MSGCRLRPPNQGGEELAPDAGPLFVLFVLSNSDNIQTRVRALAEPIAADVGCEILDVELKGGGKNRTLRVVAERLDEHGPGTGIQIKEITKITKSLGYELEVDDFIPFAYRLEVTSPGVERDLKTDRDFEKFRGQRVKVVTNEELANGDRVVEGELVEFGAERLVVKTDDEREIEVPRAAVRRARNVYDFASAGRKKSASDRD